MATPTIQSVYLNGANLKVSWFTVADKAITQYVVTVFYGVDTVFATASFTPDAPPLMTGSMTLPGGPPDVNTSYFVQVSTMWGNSPGQNETSQLVPLVTQLPLLKAAYFDGTDFHLEWTPTAQASQGYFFQLYASSGNPFSGEAPAANNWWGSIAGPSLAAGQQWFAQVAALGTTGSDDGDKVYAANAATPLLASPQPALQGLVASCRRNAAAGGPPVINAQWNALSNATGVTRYRLQTFAPDGTPGTYADVLGVGSTNGALALRDGLAPGATFRLLALNDASIGVSTMANPVLLTWPVVTLATFAPGNATINVAWSAEASTAVAGYMVEVYNLANPLQAYTQVVAGGTARSTSFSALPAGGLDATQAWGLRVWATGAAGSVPAVGEGWPLPAVAPVVAALACQGSELNVLWNLPTSAAPPAAFVVSLAVSGKVAASVRVEGSQATQARLLVPDATQSYSVSVAAIGPGGAQGPGSTAATALVAQVTGTTAATDPISGLCTLSWTAAANATSYRLDFSDGTSVTQSAAQYVFAHPLAAGSDLSVQIAPLAVTTGLSISGPGGASHRLPTQRTALQAASFSAQAMAATASWTALPGATGYRLALIANLNGTLTEVANAAAAAGTTQGSVAFPNGYTLNVSTQYGVVVQGRWGSDSGMSSSLLPIFNAGFYVSSSAASSVPPFVYPATLVTTATAPDNAKTGEPLALYLPDVGAGNALAGLPVTQGAFTLAANADANKNSATYPYVLTISNSAQGNNPWTFAPAQTLRTGLASDVQTFLKAVEAAGAVPWAMVLMQQVLARVLPQTFAEQLYYNFGLRFPGAGVPQGSVDLRPGMVLRVVPNPYQTVPGQQQGSWLTGYVGAACIDYDVGGLSSANGEWNAGFDSFIGQLVANGALGVLPPAANPSLGLEQGVAEAADLYFPAFTQSFYRLFVPNSLLSSSGVGSQKASDNFVLAAAASYTSLSSATSAPSANTTVAYFRGRAVVKACIRVSLDGVGLVVPVGTSLANLLEQSGRLSAAVAPPLTGVRIERGLGGAVLNPNAPAQPGSQTVHLDWQAANAAAYGPGWGIAALPLLPGDRIALG